MSITDHHRQFMLDLEALARKHQMSSVNITFQDAVSADRGFQQVRAHWSGGRHGAPGQIKMFYDAQEEFAEGTAALMAGR